MPQVWENRPPASGIPRDKNAGTDKQISEKCQHNKNSANIQQLGMDNNSEENHTWALTGGHKEGYHLQASINGKPLQMELDTGATISVISEYEWKKLFLHTSIVTPYVGKPLRGYSGQQLETAGQATVQVTYEKQKADLPLVIVAGEHRPALFGQNWLAIIKLNWAELHRI